MIKNIKETIEKIEKQIFDYNINSFNELFPQLINNLETILSYASFSELERVNVTLGCIETSLQNKDYLMVYDLIKFKLLADVDIITCP